MNRIASFSVDHDKIKEGIYLSRIDGDVVTFDLRTRRPNEGDYMTNLAMHSLEHLFATYIRNSRVKDDVIYFGPMGCQTGFYLLIRNPKADIGKEIVCVLEKIINHDGEMFGQSKKECGNYLNLSVEAAKQEAKRYLDKINHVDYSLFKSIEEYKYY